MPQGLSAGDLINRTNKRTIFADYTRLKEAAQLGIIVLPFNGGANQASANQNAVEGAQYTTAAEEQSYINEVLALVPSSAPAPAPVPSGPFTVTYFGNTNTGGSTPTDMLSPYTRSSSVSVLGNSGTLRKTGKVFGGWNTSADGSGTNYVGADTFNITQNTTLYANWIFAAVSIVYYGGSGGTGTAPPSSGTYYTAFSTVDVVGNTGSFTNGVKVFGGWNTAANGSGTSYAAGSEYIIPGNGTVNLYAQWIDPATTYTLTYEPGTGGSGIAPPGSPITYSSRAPATILGNIGPFTNSDSDKIFYGWNTAADGSGINYPAGSTITMNANKTLYAQWADNTVSYTVTYDANGATGSVPAPTTYPGGVQVPILGQGSLTRPGYIFLGWNGSATGAGSLYTPGYTFTSKTTTLYAQWAPGSIVKACVGGLQFSSDFTFMFTFPFAQVIASTNTITIYTTALFGTTTENYGSGLAPEGIISLISKVVITEANITINTNTTYLNPVNDYNYAYTITNGSGVTYWPSGETISSITFPTFKNNSRDVPPTYNNSSPVTYRLATRNCIDGCGLNVIAGGGVISPVSYNISFCNQGVTLNYSGGRNTVFVASPTNSFYSTNGDATPIVYSQTPNSLYPYSLIIPQRPSPVTASASSAALTSMTIIPSTASEYIYPPMPNYTVQYDGNGATDGAIPAPQYMATYTATTSITIGGVGTLTKSPSTFNGWNTAANGSGTPYAAGATYNGGASLLLYAQWT